MDKDLLKGVMLLVAVVAGGVGLTVVMSGSGPQKAECIAEALKAHVAVATIDKRCNLSSATH